MTLPKRTIDETGRAFGALRVVAYVGRERGPGAAALWRCQCRCGQPGCKGEV